MENRKRILLVNNDGLEARGIRILAGHLGKTFDVYACAPDRQRSASSHRVTYFLKDLHAFPAELAGTRAAYRVDGTPADCTYVGINGLFADVKFDCVVSGINAGWNTASDIAYSGTVAAAMEGLFLGVPAMAVSLDDYDMEHGDYGAAAQCAEKLLDIYLQDPDCSSYLLNVNVPKGKVEGIEGTVVGGIFDYGRKLETKEEGGIVTILRPLGPVPDMKDAAIDSDVAAIGRHYVSVTPLNRFGDTAGLALKLWRDIFKNYQ